MSCGMSTTIMKDFRGVGMKWDTEQVSSNYIRIVRGSRVQRFYVHTYMHVRICTGVYTYSIRL